MRVLHLGNVAQNGYNNAKLLRRLGVQADAICDEIDLFSQPEWEDADLPAPRERLPTLDELRAGEWRRPDWLFTARRQRRRGYRRLVYRRLLAASTPRLRRLHRELLPSYEPLREILGAELGFDDVVAGFRATWMHSLLVGPLEPLFRSYDVVQAYATHPALTLLATPDRPGVCYEHGTMRELPFEDSPRGRLLSLAYRRAHRVIITNADVVASARRLGLDNYAFIPHPVDETKYTPGESPLRRELEADGADFVLFAPARHDWGEKGNDRLIRALAGLVRDGREGARLVLTEWGKEVARTRGLVHELGLERHVRWVLPLPKLRLIEAYRAADVVLDQFVIGTFGGIAPEGMACSRPVVMAFDAPLHEWCFPELPPIVAARTEAEIHAQLSRLADDSAERERLGRAGRTWVERHHGWELVAGRQRAIYDEIRELEAAGARTPLPV